LCESGEMHVDRFLRLNMVSYTCRLLSPAVTDTNNYATNWKGSGFRLVGARRFIWVIGSIVDPAALVQGDNRTQLFDSLCPGVPDAALSGAAA